MKKPFSIFAFTLISLQLYSVVSACDQLYAIDFPATSLACNTNKILTTADLPNFPAAGTRKLFFGVTLERQSSTYCTGYTYNSANPSLTVAIYVNVNGVSTFIAGVLATPGSQNIYKLQAGSSAPQLATSSVLGSEPNARYSFWIDLDDPTYKLRYSTLAASRSLFSDRGYQGSSIMNFGDGADLSAILFDSTTQIYLNSGSNGITSYPFRFSDFTVGYALEQNADEVSQLRILIDRGFSTNKPSVFASYDASTLSGYSLPDSTNNLGTAYLGTSSTDSTNAPTVASTGEISFTNIAQKITLPSTVYTGDLGAGFIYSMSVSFLIKIAAYPASTQTIVSRIKQNGTEVFSVNLLANGTIVPSYSGTQYTAPSTALPLNTWTLVTVQILAFNTGTKVAFFGVINYGSTLVSQPSTATRATSFELTMDEYFTTTAKSDEATDTFKIGGFIGSLQTFKVFYNGQGMVSDGSCTTNCQYAAGSICLLPTCTSSQYQDGIRCVNCNPACATCTGAGHTMCSSCSNGYLTSDPTTCVRPPCATTEYYGSSGCTSCSSSIPNCAECSGATQCTKCSSDYQLTSTGSECREDTIESGVSGGMMIGIACGAVGLALISGVAIYLFKRRRLPEIKKKKVIAPLPKNAAPKPRIHEVIIRKEYTV